MLEHEIKSKVLTIGNRKGQTVYYAYPKSQSKMDNEMVIERIVRETSLSEGDVRNALISLSNVVCDAMKMGMSVDLAELGSFRLVVPSKMMDTGHRERRAEEPENRLHAQAADARRRQRGGAEHRPPQEGRGRGGGRNLHRLALRNLRNGPVPAWTFQRDGVYGMREIIAIFLARRGKKIEGNIANVRIYFRIFAL